MSALVQAVAKVAFSIGVSLGGTGLGLTFGNFILSSFNPVSILINVAMTVASQALTKKTKSSALSFDSALGLAASVAGRTRMIQQSITEDRIVYGQVLLSGPLAFAESYNNKADLSLAPVLADHQVKAMGEVFFNDEHVPFSSPVASGKYLGLAEITRHLGTDDQAADSALVAISGANWTNEHRGRGRAYPHIKLTFNRDKFASGIPTPKVVVSGKMMWDPRDSGITIVASTASGSQVSFETSSAHGLAFDDRAFIKDHTGSSPAIAGDYGVLAVADTTHFTIRLGFDLAGDEISLTTGGTGGTATKCEFSINPAVILTDYLLDKRVGEGADVDEINLTAAIAAANVCDETVATFTDITFTASASTDQVTLTSGSAALRKGEPVTAASTTTLPAGLAAATVYYWITTDGSTTVGKLATSRSNAMAEPATAIDITSAGTGTHTLTRAATAIFSVGDAARDELDQDTTTPAAICLGDKVQVMTSNTLPAGLSVLTDYFYTPLTPTKFKLATSRDNALAGTVIDITDSGTGTHMIQRRGEARYTCNGVIDTAIDPRENVEILRSSMAGVVVPIGGKFTMFAGASTASSETLVDEDLRAGIQVIPQRGKKALFNTCAGLFVNPSLLYEPDELPVVTSQTYRDEDNGEAIVKQFELGMTTSGSMGQRVLKIELGHNRHQATVLFPCNIAGLRFQPWDVFTYTNSRFGWTAQDFRVISWKFDPGDADRPPGVDLVARIETSLMWSWAQSSDELAAPPGPINALARADSIDAPTVLAVSSGTADLLIPGDGTVISRMRATWTAPADGYLRGYEIAWKKSSESDWQSNTFDAPQVEYFIGPVDDSVSYDVAIRSINTLGVRSDSDADPANWTAYVAAHTVAGKSAAPGDVSSLSVSQNGNVVVFGWPQVTDADLAGYEIRYMATPFVWADGTPLTEVTRGTQITTAAVPPGAWVFGIKARDTSENYSTSETTAALTVSNANDIIKQDEQAPIWAGLIAENRIRNNTMQGAVAGSPGTVPTRWSINQGALTRTLSLGTENGIDYLDVRFNGTPNSDPDIRFEATTTIAALTGEIWTQSLHLSLVGGDFTNIQGIQHHIVERTSGHAFVANEVSADFKDALTATLQQFEFTHTLDGGATTALVQPILLVNWDGSGDIDITLRIGLPKIEQNPAATKSDIKTTGTDSPKGLVKHWTGKLIPESLDLANANDDDTIFDNFCVNPVPLGIYEASEIDLGFDADGVRVWADIVSNLGPGETTGIADPALEIDFKDNAATYDGFEAWSVGTADFRQLTGKIVVDTTRGLPVVSGFKMVADVAERTESAASATIAASGTSIVFAEQFHGAPNVQITSTDGTALIATASNITATGFDANVFNSGGSDVGGAADWLATGA